MSKFTITFNQQKESWDLAELTLRLASLAKSDKKTCWIHYDLQTVKSSLLERIFWSVAKHFDFLRKFFYHIDLDCSKSLLEQLQPQVIASGEACLMRLFKKALDGFNSIAQHHAVKPFTIPAMPHQKEDHVTEAPPANEQAALSKDPNIQTNTLINEPQTETILVPAIVPASLKNLIEKAYHGRMSKSEARRLLKRERPGTFLIFKKNGYQPVDSLSTIYLAFVTEKGTSWCSKIPEWQLGQYILAYPNYFKTPLSKEKALIDFTDPFNIVPEQTFDIKDYQEIVSEAYHGSLFPEDAKTLLKDQKPGIFLVYLNNNNFVISRVSPYGHIANYTYSDTIHIMNSPPNSVFWEQCTTPLKPMMPVPVPNSLDKDIF